MISQPTSKNVPRSPSPSLTTPLPSKKDKNKAKNLTIQNKAEKISYVLANRLPKERDILLQHLQHVYTGLYVVAYYRKKGWPRSLRSLLL